MSKLPYQYQPPNLDLNALSEHYEYRFDYDRKGNLTRIRKVRRNGGCLGAVSVFLVLCAIIWMILQFQG